MPGVNVPWSQVLYYLLTLTISGVFHEFGHAISAVRYVDCSQSPILMSILDECKIHLEGRGQFGVKQEKWRDCLYFSVSHIQGT